VEARQLSKRGHGLYDCTPDPIEKTAKLTYSSLHSPTAATDIDTAIDLVDAVVLDPLPIWLDAVELVLTRIGATVIMKTSSASEALATIERARPRLLTLELDSLPGEPDGFEVMRRARTLAPNLRAIVLSAHHGAAQIDAALGAGAAAYVVKTAHPDDVASAVRQAFDHSVYLAEGQSVATPAPTARKGTESPGGLTRRELEILRLLAEGHSNSQLARMLWVTEQTVKFHLSNIYRKLGVSNRTEAGRWAQVNGLLPEEPQGSSAQA
jgi:DNA-binding NarL/FixJ family response regulator